MPQASGHSRDEGMRPEGMDLSAFGNVSARQPSRMPILAGACDSCYMVAERGRTNEQSAPSIDRQPDTELRLPSSNAVDSQADVQVFLESTLAWYRAETARGDSKCSSLLSLESAAMALLVLFATGSHSLGALSRAALVLSIVVLAASLVALLVFLRPRTIHRGPLRQANFADAPNGDQMLRLVARELAGKDPMLWRSNLLREYAIHMQVRTRQGKLAVDLLLAFVAILALVPVLQMMQ